MEARLEHVSLRGILESRGACTVEAEIKFTEGTSAKASAPIAIAPGRLERSRSHIFRLGLLDKEKEFVRLRGALEQQYFHTQRHFDTVLEELPEAAALGADVRMVLSVAFCRAMAASLNCSFVEHLSMLAGTRPKMPSPLVNIFSGGIHDRSGKLPFQQIMFLPNLGNFLLNLEAALNVYRHIEGCFEKSGGQPHYSASSGIVVLNMSVDKLLEILTRTILDNVTLDQSSIGIDVAAEHLRDHKGCYRYGDSLLEGGELLERHIELLNTYRIDLLEDPFDPQDVELWRTLRKTRRSSALIFGDDLFATNQSLIEPELADGIVLKVNQTGTLTAAIDAATKAMRSGMRLCVSHRSGETEDNLICDLAVALGAAVIKLGGPRRGDRTSKINQLLRLSENWESNRNTVENGGEK